MDFEKVEFSEEVDPIKHQCSSFMDGDEEYRGKTDFSKN